MRFQDRMVHLSFSKKKHSEAKLLIILFNEKKFKNLYICNFFFNHTEVNPFIPVFLGFLEFLDNFMYFKVNELRRLCLLFLSFIGNSKIKENNYSISFSLQVKIRFSIFKLKIRENKVK